MRTILLELERVWSHLNDISAVCAGTGLAAGAQRFAGLTERARRLNERLTGHRFLFGTVKVGGSDVTLDGAAIACAQAELESLRAESASGWRELVFNRSFDDRLRRHRRRARARRAAARRDRPGSARRRCGRRRESRQPETRVRRLRRCHVEPRAPAT